MTAAELAALAREAWQTTPPAPRRRDTTADVRARREQLRRGWAEPKETTR